MINYESITQEVDTPRALLLTKDKKIPMLWKVLSNKYSDLKFGSHRDSVGMTAAMLGLDTTDAKSKILIYTTGSKKPERYEGLQVILFLVSGNGLIV